jgi:hypothetical protein
VNALGLKEDPDSWKSQLVIIELYDVDPTDEKGRIIFTLVKWM